MVLPCDLMWTFGCQEIYCLGGKCPYGVALVIVLKASLEWGENNETFSLVAYFVYTNCHVNIHVFDDDIETDRPIDLLGANEMLIVGDTEC